MQRCSSRMMCFKLVFPGPIPTHTGKEWLHLDAINEHSLTQLQWPVGLDMGFIYGHMGLQILVHRYFMLIATLSHCLCFILCC